MSEPVTCETILEEAQRIVHGARNRDYGHPIDNHGTTAAFFEAFFEATTRTRGKLAVTPEDVCFLNILQKISRAANGRLTRDTLVDTSGYAANIEMVQDERTRRGG